MGVLTGIRVLDASRILAGPHCGQMLADNGAEVIKMEPPEGDQNRAWLPVVDGQSTNYLSVNRGKQAITLNLKTAHGRELFHALIRQCDVFLQNYLPDAAVSLAADYETLSRVNPRLIYASIGGYGARGPLRNRPGYDTMVNAYCGIMAMTGEPDRAPVRAGVSAIDMTSGILAYSGILTALLARATGQAEGQRVDVSLLETGITLVGHHALNWMIAGLVDQREGGHNSRIVPYGPHRCQDGDIMLGAPNDGAWLKLCQVLGAQHLLDDPRFATNSSRCEYPETITAALEAILATAPVRSWVERIAAAGIACAPISTLDQVMADEQVLANDMVVHVPTSDGRTMPLVGLPFKLSATPGKPGHAPPILGEHTDAVLQRLLGLGPDELRSLRSDRVI
jgi:crotonobetainyl-CoA:carnitine CoA-transferase CaiB-like acyl-CoA transferase